MNEGIVTKPRRLPIVGPTGAAPLPAAIPVSISTDYLVDACEAIASWAMSVGAANLAVSANHILGARALTFDKIAGNVESSIGKVITPALDASNFNPVDVISAAVFIPALADVDYAFIRIGTDAANYSEWQVPVAQLQANTWLTLSPSLGGLAAVVGTGCVFANITYTAVGIVFNLAGDALAGIIFDHIYLRRIVASSAQINAEITTKIEDVDINVKEIAGTLTEVDHGVSGDGTQRTAANIISGQDGVTGGSGVTDAATQRVAANPIPGQSGVTGGAGVSDAATQRTAANIIDGQTGVTGGAGATDAATQRVAANVADGAGTPALDADPLPVEVGDGTNQLLVAVRDLVSAGNGILGILEYNAVPPAVADGEQVPEQSNAFGNAEKADFSRVLQGSKVFEQAPPIYDKERLETVRASAALTAAYVVTTDYPTILRAAGVIHCTYTRGAAGGGFRTMVELGYTYSGVDIWVRVPAIEPGVVSEGSDAQHLYQPLEIDNYAEDAAAGLFMIPVPLYGADKIRVSFKEIGVPGTPGTLAADGMLFNYPLPLPIPSDSKAFTVATDSKRTQEITPLDTKYIEEQLAYTAALPAAGTTYYPSTAGGILGARKDLSIDFGMTGGAATTVTLTFEVCNDDVTPLWHDITIAGYLKSNPAGVAAFYATAAAGTLNGLIDFDDLNAKKWRVKIVTSAGAVSVLHLFSRSKAI